MTRKINITIENKLIAEKRDMNVYHRSTDSAHMISYNNSITLPLKPGSENDFLHISIVCGPGHLDGNCILNLPSWADFEFTSNGDLAVSHSGGRTFLKIPPGLPVWQLKITRSHSLFIQKEDHVTIGDDRIIARNGS